MSQNFCVFLVVVVVISCLGALAWRGPWRNDSDSIEVIISDRDGEEIVVKIELVETPEERARGLSGRESLGEKNGMLFVYEENVQHGFWMENTYIPLSIAFISSNGKIIDIQDMEPLSLETHKPNSPYRYTLEVNQGFFDDHGITENDKVTIPREAH